MNLAIRAAKTAVVGLLVLGIIIFVPAGTLAYWQGWVFIIVFTVATNIIGIYLALKDPVLLERRIKAGPGAETRPAQKALIAFAFAAAIGLVIVSVLDHRFGWSHVAAWVSVFGNILVALGLMIDLLVFRENSYGSAAIEKMAILVLRILDEEKMLESDLDGYTNYMRTVRYRLVPGLW